MDPPDGRLPPLTPEAERRSTSPEARRVTQAGRGIVPPVSWDDLSPGSRCIHHGRAGPPINPVRSFAELRSVDPGYDTTDIFTFQTAPEGDFSDDWWTTSAGRGGVARWFAQFHLNLMDRVAAIPGVESVGIVRNVPLDEGVDETRFLTGDVARDEDGGTLLNVTWTGGDYFETMGIELLQGQAFTRADHVSELGNVIISQSAAARLWPGENPIGRRFRPRDSETWETVIGVVEDVKQLDFRDEAEPLVYLPLMATTLRGGFMNLLTSKWVEAIDFGSRNGVEEGVDEAQFLRNTNRASR